MAAAEIRPAAATQWSATTGNAQTKHGRAIIQQFAACTSSLRHAYRLLSNGDAPALRSHMAQSRAWTALCNMLHEAVKDKAKDDGSDVNHAGTLAAQTLEAVDFGGASFTPLTLLVVVVLDEADSRLGGFLTVRFFFPPSSPAEQPMGSHQGPWT